MQTYTVILPVKDGSNYLESALKSIIDQSYPPHEIILVDDNSSDNTVEIAHSYGVRVIKNKGIGQAAALNTGIELCNSDLVSFLDHDDTWTKDKQEKQILAFNENQQLDYVTCQVINFENSGNQRNMGNSRVLGACTFSLNFLKTIGPFDEQLKHHAVIEWWGRPGIPKAISLDIKEPLYMRLIHDSNLTVKYKEDTRKSLLEAVRLSLINKR
jgi:glycosyltransferase involved in cell wall biosynthesis